MAIRNSSPIPFQLPNNQLLRLPETIALMERPAPAELLANRETPPTCKDFTRLRGLDVLRQKVKRKNLEFDRLVRENAELLETAVHDLRLPISSIRIYSELLAEGISDKATPEVIEWVNAVRTVSQFAVRLLDETSNLGRLESGTARLYSEESILASIVEKSVSMSCPLAARKNIQLAFVQYGEPRPVLLDQVKMTKVFNNLIENAIKYCQSGARVEVRVWRFEHRVMVSVEDNGPGIEPADLKTLFTPFQRTRARALSDEHSAGLGLAIAQRMVRLHGGQISVKSEVGVGTTFYVSLPARVPLAKTS